MLGVGTLAAEQLLLPPHAQPTAKVLLAAIDWYRAEGSARLRSRSAIRCRFEPSCSRYARAAIVEYGSVKGARLTLWRLVRCGPWTPKGTSEPVPLRDQALTGVQSR